MELAMKTPLEKERQILIDTFDGFTDDYLKTLAEISKASAVDLEDMIEIVFTSPDFVRVPGKLKNGQPVYTTRKVYRKRTPFLLQLLTAF